MANINVGRSSTNVNARPAWYCAVTGCMQMLVGSNHDIDVETGTLEYGEARPNAFATLLSTLTTEQRRALALLAAADTATWPQLSVSELSILASDLAERVGTKKLGQEACVREEALVGSPLASVLAALAFERQLSESSVSPDPDRLRVAIHAIARRSSDPRAYWEQWLRRTVPQAVRLDLREATTLMQEALSLSLPLVWPWHFRATKDRSGRGCVIDTIDASRQSTPVAQFAPIRFLGRRLETNITLQVALDRYRIGYIFQTLVVENVLDDVIDLGSFDEAVCLDASGSPVWSFSPF